jgi:alanyl-tRNA synthetase
MTMATERLYYDDSYTTKFEAEVASAGDHEGRPAVSLASTYFYPESGGQEADRGQIGGHAVVDVQAAEDGTVWHVLEGEAPRGGTARLEAEVDWARRFDHMQQHTGQHILSAAFERILGSPTVSSHLGEARSTIETPLPEVDWTVIERLERASNDIVWQDLNIERHWVDDEGVKRFALRKPPKQTERIRIVEIPDWDVSACGGTHTRRTGEVGVIKIVRWERVRANLRFEFLCGGRALSDYAWRTESLLESAKRRTLADRDLIAHLERAADERDALQKQVRELNERLAIVEATESVGSPPRPVAELRASWSRENARTFALKCLEVGAPWVIAAGSTPAPVLVCGRAKSGGPDLRALVPELLAETGGKGGGSPDLVQVAPADVVGVARGFEWLRQRLEAAEPSSR